MINKNLNLYANRLVNAFLNNKIISPLPLKYTKKISEAQKLRRLCESKIKKPISGYKAAGTGFPVLKKLKEKEPFYATVYKHNVLKNKKTVTLTAVRYKNPKGVLNINKSKRVIAIKEKPTEYINGGFFVMSPKFLEFIEGDNTVLESKPLEKVTDLKEIRAFKHEGFWQCMDHKLDKDLLDGMVKDNKAPWIKK